MRNNPLNTNAPLNKTNMKSLKILALLLSIVVSIPTLAQNKKIEKANMLFESGEFFKAIEKYKKLYSKTRNKKDKATIAFKSGMCYRAINSPKKAQSWFKRAIRGKYPDPKSVLYYADALKKIENYEEAKLQYQKYTEMVPDDNAGKIGIESCESALIWLEKPTSIKVELLKSVSSRQMDYSPTIADRDDKTIFFVSSREGATGNKFSNASGQNFSDIFTVTVDRKGEWSEPVPIDGEVNTNFDEGPMALTDDMETMYFTQCEQKKNEDAGCRIFKAKKVADSWGDISEVILVQDSSVTVAHPALSPDGQTLYFVSNMEGGQGGKDIWKATKKGNKWVTPVNLGVEINTPGDEMFPYIHSDGAIYFSSNYHKGLGGLDIFRYGKNKNDQLQLTNLKAPMNSPQDDFGITFDSTGKKGFFSSTRSISGKKSDNVYSFEMPDLKFSLKGLVVDITTNRPIEGADINFTGSDGTNLETRTNVNGKFTFKLKSETDYVAVATSNNYFTNKATETTKGLNRSTVLNVKIELEQIKKEVAFAVENINYDLDKATLKPNSLVSLDKLVDLLELNKSLIIELGAHTDYQGGDDYNTDLSQRRAQSVVNYLIASGIKKKRLVAKGYGETIPKKINSKLHTKYPDFPVGDVLTEDYIKNLKSTEQRKQANQINRRTEFKVLRTDFKIKAESFGN